MLPVAACSAIDAPYSGAVEEHPETAGRRAVDPMSYIHTPPILLLSQQGMLVLSLVLLLLLMQMLLLMGSPWCLRCIVITCGVAPQGRRRGVPSLPPRL